MEEFEHLVGKKRKVRLCSPNRGESQENCKLETKEELVVVDENVDLNEIVELSDTESSRNMDGSKSVVNNSRDTSYHNLLESLRSPMVPSTPHRPISSPLPAEPAPIVPEEVATPRTTSTELKSQLMESLESSTNATKLLHVMKENELGENFRREWKRHKSEFIEQFLNDIISLKVTYPIKFLNGWSKELMLMDIKNYQAAKEREEREREGNLLHEASSIISNQDQSERGM
jgi:hypothetical protein